MIRSMTGYSRLRREEGDFSLSVGIKSTNHRFLDLQVRVPAELEPLEAALRRRVKDHVARGHVEVTVSLERAGSSELHMDRKLLEAYATACRTLGSEFGFGSAPDPVALLRIPGILAGSGEIPLEEMERIRKALETVMTETLEQLNEMRGREGEALENDLRQRLDRLRQLLNDVHKLSQRAAPLYQQRLESRLRDTLGSAELDPARLAQEVAYLVSRSDIAEELTRFRSHLDQVARVIEESSEVGKKLDFLLQEMNREANTVLSKTTDVPDVGLEIARQAIEMKTEIEKLREQSQNIE
jgi:uncharacterized protein (TIGR00255 family)